MGLLLLLAVHRGRERDVHSSESEISNIGSLSLRLLESAVLEAFCHTFLCALACAGRRWTASRAECSSFVAVMADGNMSLKP